MTIRSHFPNNSSSGYVRIFGNDFACLVLENGTMAVRTKSKQKSRGYAREWLQGATLRQADLVRLLDWPKAKAFAIWHGDQQLTEAILDELAPLVHAKPYELLMPPELAMQLRRFEAILKEAAKPIDPPPVPASADQRRKAS